MRRFRIISHTRVSEGAPDGIKLETIKSPTLMGALLQSTAHTDDIMSVEESN